MPPKPIVNEDIYDALVDDDCFARLPGLLASTFGGQSTLIQWCHPDDGVDVLGHSGHFTERQLTRYAEEFAVHDPWLIAAAAENITNQALSLEELVPTAQFIDSFFYNEFVLPMNLDTFRCLGVRVANDWGAGIVAIHRGRSQRSFDANAVAALDTHVVALRRMLAVRGRFGALDRRRRAIEAMLDHMGQAALTVRPDGTLVHANAAGESLLRRGDSLALRHGVVSALSSQTAPRLRRAIGEACAPSGMEAAALLIDRPSGKPLAASVMPFRSPGGRRDALIIVRDEAGVGSEAAHFLRSLYGLTRAEAEIAVRIADGINPAGVASERGVSVATVRAQVKALAAKLGCGRQSEIAALVRALPVVAKRPS